MLIWSTGTRVVPFTFVPVSARVPACQQSARRWVISAQPGGRAAGRVDSLPGSPDSDGCGLPPRETVFVVGRRPSATHPTSGVGGERKRAGQTGGNAGKPTISWLAKWPGKPGNPQQAHMSLTVGI